MKAAMAGGKSRKKKWAKGKAPKLGHVGTGAPKSWGFCQQKRGQRRANGRRFQSPYTIFSSIICYQ